MSLTIYPRIEQRSPGELVAEFPRHHHPGKGTPMKTPDTPSISHMVGQFHAACDVHEPLLPTLVDRTTAGLRIDLLNEEYNELVDAYSDEDLIGIADALADIIYLAYGTARIHGIDLDDVLAEVHRSNVAKVVDGKVIRRTDGKILKPDDWTAPDVAAVLEGQGWTE